MASSVCRLALHRHLSARPFVAVLLGSLLALGAPDLGAQEPGPRCQDEEFRQFDFWVGHWEVFDPEGARVGSSHIEVIMDGCAVRENWDSGQVRGTSLNAYDAPSGVWRQMWADNRGAVLRIEGAWEAGSMRLTGRRLGSDGVTRDLRITWTPLEDGGVRQLQEVSEDEGVTWAVGFDGRYRKADGEG